MSKKLLQTLNNLNLQSSTQPDLLTSLQDDKQLDLAQVELETKLGDNPNSHIDNQNNNKSTSQLVSETAIMSTSQQVNRNLKSVRIDQTILERIKDMVYFESKKRNKVLEQDIFEIALRDFLTKNGY